MSPLLIRGMKGLGDNIYQRPFLRAACATGREVFLETPWPEIYADLPVKPVRTATKLRTQAENEARVPDARWTVAPPDAERVTVAYGNTALAMGTIVRAMERALPLGRTRFAFDLPPLAGTPVVTDRPIAVVRPVTVRREWRNEARNPRPEYIAQISRDLRRTHYVVVVAHLAAGEEWLLGELPEHDKAFLAGELNVTQLLALIAAADVVVGGVGWIVPATIAAGRNGFFVLGGQGGHNAPEKITDPRMDLSRIGWAKPDPYCRCARMEHRCAKTIKDLPATWSAFRARLAAR